MTCGATRRRPTWTLQVDIIENDAYVDLTYKLKSCTYLFDDYYDCSSIHVGDSIYTVLKYSFPSIYLEAELNYTSNKHTY